MKKTCPIFGVECCEEKCAWYSETYDECSVKSMGESLTTFASLSEDDEINVRIVNDD